MPISVGQLLTDVLAAYPAVLAEAWDTGIGLSCGDPGDVVSGVLLAVDLTAEVLAEAQRIGASLVITHHPLLFAPVQSVAADTAKGALVHGLVRSGIAHFSAHTNADKAVGGVNDALADLLRLSGAYPLVPDPAGLLPAGHPQAGRTGIGRVGQLPAPVTLQAFVDLVAAVLPATVGGVRAAGDPLRLISTVALCGGAGGAELAAATAAGADVYLTSDLRHHSVLEHLADPGAPAVVDVAHWAGEWPWLAAAAKVITAGLTRSGVAGSLPVTVSAVRTDPWTIQSR